MNKAEQKKPEYLQQIETPRIAMLSTGEEVLFGDIVDTNASWLSAFLFENGFQMTTRLTVADSLDAISNGLTQLAKNHDVVIVNGGLGPTSDDMTAQAAALATNTELVLYDEWVVRMKQMFAKWQRPMPDSNIKQAMLPAGSRLIDNPRGTACGFSTQVGQATCYFTPGVPHEFKAMSQFILSDIKLQYCKVPDKQIHRIYTFGLSESGIANQIEALTKPDDVTLGYRSALPFIEVKVFYTKLTPAVEAFLLDVEQELTANTVSINQDIRDNTMALLKQHAKSLALFDYSTQGYLHHWISNSAENHQVAINSVNLPSQPCKVVLDTEIEQIESLYSQFSLEKSGSNGFLIKDTQQGGVQLSLLDQDKISSQCVEFKREYSFQARKVVISAIAVDMLRRSLDNKPVFADYGSVTRVASNVKKL
ncbi:hypothetical protein A9264_07400 [Vibrio sp. UCD-FRSSP16_10]|uniref:molybdopterin-binding protein n=1 Tax=unclassified Vibrio TaxID=2614977 RepID=UPI0007FEC371|nr:MULTISPECIES: molybdopterin-binding protein [unclassified Vibrio]OBT13481.1 hypothetical protein A9264_07400 [Vibrio sp. UCD-FRSSP16_10]OBT17990.1 hypothetical protein A9260_01390 [Vibrio sp. UCD-FRSSP16_30]